MFSISWLLIKLPSARCILLFANGWPIISMGLSLLQSWILGLLFGFAVEFGMLIISPALLIMSGHIVRLVLLYSHTLSRVMWNFSRLGILKGCLGVNKWPKEASIPMLFSAVIFESSMSNLNGPKQLSRSDIRHHVLSWHTFPQKYPNLILWTVLSFRYDRTNSWIEISIGVLMFWTVHSLVTTLTG